MTSDSQIFDIYSLLLNLPESDYFRNVLTTSNMEVGVIKLKKNQQDTQQPHDFDEIYYIISGNGSLDIDGTKNDICPGKVIYIPRKIPHSFQSHSNELIVLYVLA